MTITTISSGTLILGIKNSVLGSLLLNGSSSGIISIKPQAAAGTYNFNLPTTAGTAGQVLTSQGGDSTAMTWTTTPTIHPGITGQVAYYSSSSTPATISGESLSNLIDASIDNTQGDILYRGASGWTFLSPGSNGNVLRTNGPGADPTWESLSGVSVTSLTGDGVIIANTDSFGAVTISLEDATANFVLAGPTSGSPATPTYRSLVSADIPDNAANTTGTSSNVTGIISILNGGTGTTTPALVAGSNVTITGTWPNQTISSSNPGGTVTSTTFTGDGTILSSTPSSAVTSSGTLTAVLANAPAETVLANATNASATPTYVTMSTLMSSLGFSNSLGALGSSGYQKIPGGLIVQWGTVSNSGNTSTAVTYPTPFTTNTIGIIYGNIVSTLAVGDLSSGTDNTTPPTTTGFSWYNATSGTLEAFWIAIGI